jgi:peptidoglycan/LPS O-acetylase OafA/YrhL
VLLVLLVPKEPPFLAFTKPRLHLTLLSLASAGLLVAATRLRLGPRPLVLLRPLRACGRLSYEIYLTHMFVVLAAARLFDARGWAKPAAYPLVVLICVACWALGALVERYISAPASRWLRLHAFCT